MEFDDISPKADDAINGLLKEDLSSHSIAELEERINILAEEVDRIKILIISKKVSRDEADSVFN